MVCADELGPVIPAASHPPPAGPRRPPGQGPAGLRPRPGEDLGLRRAAPGRRPHPHPDRAVPQQRRLPAAASRGPGRQPHRRPDRDHRQPLQPHQCRHPRVADRPPPDPAGVHPQTGLLAQPPGGLVAASSPPSACRAVVCHPGGDHPGDHGRDLPAQRPRPPVGVGTATTVPTPPTPRPYLPDLANVAIGGGELHSCKIRRAAQIRAPTTRPGLSRWARPIRLQLPSGVPVTRDVRTAYAGDQRVEVMDTISHGEVVSYRFEIEV